MEWKSPTRVVSLVPPPLYFPPTPMFNMRSFDAAIVRGNRKSGELTLSTSASFFSGSVMEWP